MNLARPQTESSGLFLSFGLSSSATASPAAPGTTPAFQLEATITYGRSSFDPPVPPSYRINLSAVEGETLTEGSGTYVDIDYSKSHFFSFVSVYNADMDRYSVLAEVYELNLDGSVGDLKFGHSFNDLYLPTLSSEGTNYLWFGLSSGRATTRGLVSIESFTTNIPEPGQIGAMIGISVLLAVAALRKNRSHR